MTEMSLIKNTKENKKIIKKIFRNHMFELTKHAIERLYSRCAFMSNIDVDILAERLSSSIQAKVKRNGIAKVFSQKNKIIKDGKEEYTYTGAFHINGIKFIVSYNPKKNNYTILTIIIKDRNSQ